MSTGIDGIGPILLVEMQFLQSSLVFINNSMCTGIFPEKLKEACVFPIFKGGSKEDPSNYRPISILYTISKIFEKHVSTQLFKKKRYTP